MKSIAILKIQLQGIISCIEKYTSEPSITTIRDSLTTALSENNFEIILFSCSEIYKWYGKNISQICSNEFVSNKSVHKENFQLIKNIIAELEENSMKYKNVLSVLTDAPAINNFELHNLMYLLDRFHQVAIQLCDRYQNRETLNVKDEYDVQDLLHSLLKICCDDIRTEEWTPSYAGSSSRQDFLLKNEKIVIETKKTREGLGNKVLANELIIDIARYKKHPDCKSLVCFVYDPENRIKNPRGFENDLSKSEDSINVIISIRP